jgi:hypothetical protein
MQENYSLKTNSSRHSTKFAFILFVALLPGIFWGQSTPAQPAAPPATQSPNQPAPAPPNVSQQPVTSQTPNPAGGTLVPGAGITVQDQQQGSATAQSSGQPEPETRITKAQAKELFRSVDVILRFASQDTNLPIERQVKRNLITRESVEKYVAKRMKDDKDAQRLEQSRLVLEKFGLLPPGYDLHGEFLRLLGEQVAAYYDPKNKSVNLLDWVPPDTQKPVLAHELTHALQDQKIGLEKWERAGAKDDKPLPDQQEYVVEEAQAARQCVAEGQAMIVLLDYSLAPTGKDVVSAPEIFDAMRAGMADNKDSPVFAAAPMFLRESLMMPYTWGTDFVRAVLTSKGKDAAYGGMLENPPVDTRQVMEPETYLLNLAVAPLIIPDLDKLVAPDYKRFDFGGMGEFDVYLLAKQYGGDEAPRNYYPHWRGGYYFASQAKTAPKGQIAMLYFSRWDSPESARAFAKLYGDYLPKRYKDVAWTAGCLTGPNASGCSHAEALTEQGKVVMEFRGNDLLIMESFDDEVIERAGNVLLNGTSLPATAAKSGK